MISLYGFFTLYLLIVVVSSLRHDKKMTLSKKVLSRFANTFFWIIIWTGLLFYRPLLINGDLYQVRGDSMQPTFFDGEVVYVALSHSKEVEVGDIVVASPKKISKIVIKRIEAIRKVGDGYELFLTSDNLYNSFDSRSFGWVDSDDLIGIVQWKL